jgi:phosphatidylserine/phosphatidylglycerophosphate/cardiolipin synthase-like enzyme
MDIAAAIKADPVLRHRAKMHTQSTQSHAKLLVADQGGESGWVAVVGSCNWLSTGYRRVEGSVVLRDGRLVAGVLDELRELCYASAPRSALIGELDWLAASARGTRSPRGSAHVRLVLGDEHGLMMAHARDAAAVRIWVGGDRFSHAGEAQTLIPMMAAAKGGVRGRLLFSRNVSPVTDEDLADLRQLALERGVELSEVPEGVLHGKFLLWDRDDLVITSLNWSSASTRRDNPWGEIGVHIRRTGIADAAAQHIGRDIERAAAEPAPRRRHPGRRG